ncbi:hypothetical protein H1R20_g870, partial [Candolleomyces eurysporus]
MSSANAPPPVGQSGGPKRSGWWWKKRKERLKKRQAVENVREAQKIPASPLIKELPHDATAAEATVAAAVQNNPEAGIVVSAKKRRNKQRMKKKKKKKTVKDDDSVKLVLTEEAVLSEPESEPIPDGPLKRWFAQYEGFNYHASLAPTQEFRRLCSTMDWKRGGLEALEARADFGRAIVSQFNYTYGEDADDLSAWQRLCRRIGIDPIPDKLEEAKERVCNTHINLVDLIGDTVVRKFPSEKALSNYTRKTKKTFPQSATSGTLLYLLLRRIHFPPPEGSRRNANNDIIQENLEPEPERMHD